MWHPVATKHDLLRGHKEDAENLADARKTARVDLADVDSLCLEELFEYHPVVGMFSGGDADSVGLKGFPDGSVTENVIGSGGFFDEPTRISVRLREGTI